MGFRDDIPVTYQDGAFHPDQPVTLPAGAKGRVAVDADGPTPASRQAAWELFERIRREGLISLGPGRIYREDLYDRR